MTVQIAEAPAAKPRRKAPEPLTYSGEALMADVRAVVRSGGKAHKLSGFEVDALVQTLALAHVERPELLTTPSREPRPLAERRAILKNDLKDLLRDSRSWLDSVDGWKPRENTKRTARGGRIGKGLALRPSALPLSVQEQAAAHRASARKLDGRISQTSADALMERHTVEDESGLTGIDYLAIAAHQAAEKAAGEALPAPALTEHNRVLTRAVATRLARENDVSESDVRVALYCHADERLEAIALAERVSIATAKRRSARGTEALEAIGKWAIRETRRAEAVRLGLAPADVGPVLGDVERAAERAIAAAKRNGYVLAASYNAGRRTDSRSREYASDWNGPRTYRLGSGRAADVLAYIATAERSVERPVWTYSTEGATTLTDVERAPSGYRHPSTPRSEARYERSEPSERVLAASRASEHRAASRESMRKHSKPGAVID